ncbi:MAG: alkaline phosphatase D family protein [Erythrobacter sp.]
MTNSISAESPIPQTTRLSRRDLFHLAGAGSALMATPLAARGFGSGFTHSVASGEPSQTSVLLWTRYVGDVDRIEWVISKNADLSQPVQNGEAPVSAERDYCVKVELAPNSLEPDCWYFFQFIAPDGTRSAIGRTRTLPEGPTQNFRMAVFSCANFGFGWFNSYAHAAQANDCDLALHLGDYLYEYESGTYPAADQAHPQRHLNPDHEIVALSDYRLRYATYRADPDLQRLHQIVPMIAIWDDHESANDSWRDGAQNHQPETEGEWAVRKAVAKRVYREWMPVSDRPYAHYQVGDLATLFRLDTRLEGRDQQFDLAKVLEGVSDPQSAMTALSAFREGEYADPDRQMLGLRQEQWLADALAQSRGEGTVWQVLVQQVLMGQLKTPPSIISMLGDELPQWARQRLLAAAAASLAGVPANMDAWDGYPAARERVLNSALEADANLLVLAGDTHNGWAFELDQNGTSAGVEFGVPGVTSPGLESSLSAIPAGDFAAAAVAANEQLVWADTSQRGYMLVELTPQRATTEMRFVDTIRTRSARLAGTKRITCAAGSHALAI